MITEIYKRGLGFNFHFNLNISDLYSQPDQRWVDSTCENICVCSSGVVSCQSYGCDENAECSIRNGIRGCYCQNGFEGDGQECTRGTVTNCEMYLKILIII